MIQIKKLDIVLVSLLVLVAGCSDQHLTVSSSGETSALADMMDTLLDDDQFSSAFWGIRIEKMDGSVVYERNSEKLFTPASNFKLFTTAAALDLLGADFRYETRVEAAGKIDGNGVLHGDLVIVGSGDPSLGAWHPDASRNSSQLLDEWCGRVKASGIKRITGNIIGDGRCFTEQYYGPFWHYWDLPYWYATGSSGLAIEENAYRVRMRPGDAIGDPGRIRAIPKTTYFTIINDTKTVAAGEPSTADSTNYDTEGNVKRFIGNLAIDKKMKPERGSIWDGAKYAAWMFREALERSGIHVEGSAENIRELSPLEGDRKLVLRHTSPTMKEIVKVINEASHNFFADQIARTMAYKIGKEGSFEESAVVVGDWLGKKGMPGADRFRMIDGSGLSTDDMIQPRQMCWLLRTMRNDSPAGKAFYSSLSVAGEEGWVKKRLTDPKVKGRIRAKTGYIEYARSLSGYVMTPDDEEWVFCMICNNYTTSSKDVDKVVDAVLARIAKTGK